MSDPARAVKMDLGERIPPGSDITLFVGNPGTGKSTLLNSLCGGQAIFKAGLSFGKGLTSVLQLAKCAERSYIGDTPGLSDVIMRKKAGEEIERGLKQNGDYRLVFVITLEAGRVRPEDAMTVRLILESVDANIPFGILINKLEDEAFEALSQDHEAQRDVMTAILSGLEGRATSHFHLVKHEVSLRAKKNAIAPPEVTRALKEWLATLSFMHVESEQVREINTDTWEEGLEKASKEIAELKANKAKMEEKFKEIIEREREEAEQREKEMQTKVNREISGLRMENEEQRKKFEADFDRARCDYERSVEEARKSARRSGGGGFFSSLGGLLDTIFHF